MGKGYQIGRLPLLVAGLLVLGCLVAVIVLAVLFAGQATELSEIRDLMNATSIRPRSTTPTGTAGTTPLPTAATTAMAPVFREDYRLPTNIIPLHYDLYLQVYLPFNKGEETDAKAFTTVGKVTIDIRCLVATDVVILHTWDSVIHEGRSFLTDWEHQNVKINRFELDPKRHFLILHLDQNLISGRKYQLEISYTGLIVTETDGFYRSSYTTPAGELRWLATTQFQPHKARRMFPCFDEPGLRATFQFAVKHDSRHVAYSVRRAISIDKFKDDERWTETRFERSVPMPAYLLALVISDFKRLNGTTSDGIDFGVISHEDTVEQARFALRVGMEMTERAGTKFGRSYLKTNPKLDMVAVPDFDAGAMENWGLIAYRERLMLYEKGVSSAGDKMEIARVIGHELAHQWFGNAVTCKWWSNSFLNEGFAAYLMNILAAPSVPDWHLEKSFLTLVTAPALNADATISTVPLYNPELNTPDEVMTMFTAFNDITYEKGASVLRMIEGVMGTESFDEALKRYLTERIADGESATYEQLLGAFTRQSNQGINPEDFVQLFDTWISQRGFPVVTVTLNHPDNTQFTVTQQRFLLGGRTLPAGEERSWHIPFTYLVRGQGAEAPDEGAITNGPHASLTWLTKDNAAPKVVTLADLTHLEPPVTRADWVLANVQGTGFYRVNYDTTTWAALTQQLTTDHDAIGLFNRVQLISDAFNLARSGFVTYDVPIKLIAYMEPAGGETEYPPWSAALSGLAYIDSMIRPNDIQTAYMKKFIGLNYNDNWWRSTAVWQDDVVDGENYQELTRRLAIVETACYYDVGTCRQQAKIEFDKWTDPTNPYVVLDPHFKDSILCYAVRDTAGGAAAFDRVYEQYLRPTTKAAIKASLLRGLGCASEVTLINRLLAMTLDTTLVRDTDTASVFRSTTKFAAGHDATWEFLKNNWNRMAANGRNRMIGVVLDGFSTQAKYDDIVAFQARLAAANPSYPEKTTFDNSRVKIETNIKWLATYKDSVIAAMTPGAPAPAP